VMRSMHHNRQSSYAVCCECSPPLVAERYATAFFVDQLNSVPSIHIPCSLSPHFEIRPVQSTSPDAYRRVVSPT
jgi:hypothetical protein